MSDDTPPQPGAGRLPTPETIQEWRKFIGLADRQADALGIRRTALTPDITYDELEQFINAAERCHAMEEGAPDLALSFMQERDQLSRDLSGCIEQRNKALAEIADLKAKLLDAQSAATPTQWAYDQACAALEKHRHRADEAEAELSRVRAVMAENAKAIGEARELLCLGHDLKQQAFEQVVKERDAARSELDRWMAMQTRICNERDAATEKLKECLDIVRALNGALE